MKFKIVRSKFLEGLKKVQNIVGSKGTMQILQNVMIEAREKQLLLTTTDLDISIRSVIECEVDDEGSTTLPVKLLFSVISKAAEGVVEVEVDSQDRAIIKAGTATFKITGMSVVDYPALPVDLVHCQTVRIRFSALFPASNAGHVPDHTDPDHIL